MDLKEFAERENISVQRAATLARQGRIAATKNGKTWTVEPDTVLIRRTRRRLSTQSQKDFITFLNEGTLDHVKGDAKRRTAIRVREYWGAENPAQLLREWFYGTQTFGRGGAAVIQAAQAGNNHQVKDAQTRKPYWVLKGRARVSGRISDYMAIRGLTAEDVSGAAGVPIETVHSLARRGYSISGNLDTGRVTRALNLPAVHINAVEMSK